MASPIQSLIPNYDPDKKYTDDEILDFTRKLRIEALRDLVQSGKISEDSSDRNFFTSLVSGLDAQAIQNKKIATDQKIATGNAAVIADILAKIPANAFAAKPGEIVDVSTKVLPDTVPPAIPVPGETDVAPPQLDYDSFVKANEKPIS